MNVYCKEIEARYIREHDLFEVGCLDCGYKTTTTDRRWPKDIYIEFLVGRGCSCESLKQ